MDGMQIFCLTVMLGSVFLTFALLPDRTEADAERSACERLATMTLSGEVGLEDYLATRCKAGLLETNG